MRITLEVGGALRNADREVPLAPARALLDAVAGEGSVQGAARRLGLSYRAAWGRLAALEDALGRPVVAKTKGHGSVLTGFGAELRDALAATLGRVEAGLAPERAVLEARLAILLGTGPVRLRLAGSHDPLLLDALAGRWEIDFSVAGSLDALARLAAGAADAAGFHFGAASEAPPPFDAVFGDPDLAVTPLFRREQGLMLAAGNPLGIATIADLGGRRARFVNRQRGAGTRIWFDRLRAEAGLGPDDVAVTATEEFTHQAVGALIASGAADAGMGTRHVAERFGLAFLPVGWETYFLAVRVSVPSARVAGFVAAVRDAAGAAAGYAPPGPD